MNGAPDDPREWEHPLCLLGGSFEDYVAWQSEVGPEEADRLITDATRRHMEKYGVRSVLEIGERLEHMLAKLEEHIAVVRTDYTREELVALCEDAIRPESVWHNRDSERAHRQLGEAWVLLKAGCEFQVVVDDPHTKTDDRTIWVEIVSKGFNWFESHVMSKDTRYIPTRERLEQVGEEDWY